MKGHIILVYPDNGEVVFKLSDAIDESAMGSSLVQPVATLLKNNTKAQLVQKAKQSGYQAFTKENYDELYPLKDDLYLFVNLIQDKVDIYARYRPFFNSDDILDLPEPETDPLNPVCSLSLKDAKKLEKAMEQVLGEIEYLRWINDGRGKELNYWSDEGIVRFHVDTPANRTPKVFKEILKSNGYSIVKDNNWDSRYWAQKYVDTGLDKPEQEALIKKEKKALRVDESEKEIEDYIQNLPLKVKVDWSNRLYMETGESLMTAIEPDSVTRYHYGQGQKSIVRESGYIFSNKDFDEIFQGVPLRIAVVLAKEFECDHKKEDEGTEYYHMLVNGYVRKVYEIVLPKQISLLMQNVNLIDDPELTRLVNKYKLMEQHINGHYHHY